MPKEIIAITICSLVILVAWIAISELRRRAKMTLLERREEDRKIEEDLRIW